MSLDEQAEKCMKIHDSLAEFWNWAYYNTDTRDCSWLLAEYVKKLKPDVENRVPIMVKEIEEILQQYSGNVFSLLDIGCGVGGFLHKLILTIPKQYPEVQLKMSGIDISNEMITYAKQNLDDYNIELICGNIGDNNLSLINEPFDAAILMVTLSFYNDEGAEQILHAIHDRLKQGGNLVVMDFAWSYKWKNFKLFAKPLQRLTDMFFSHLIGESFHFANRTEDHIKKLLANTGFEISRSYLSEIKSKMKGMQIIVASKKPIIEESVDMALRLPATSH